MIIVLADKYQKEELLSGGLKDNAPIKWAEEISEFTENSIEACIDLLFINDQKRIGMLRKIGDVPIIIGSTITTLLSLPSNFVRINNWQTFLKKPIIEAFCKDEKIKQKAEAVFSCFNKKMEWVPDIPGFITARVIASIINEAYFALDEEVSSKKDIDTAMKLGTNYPYGPFEWSEKIGLKNIYELLLELSKTNQRYQPSELLTKEASA